MNGNELAVFCLIILFLGAYTLLFDDSEGDGINRAIFYVWHLGIGVLIIDYFRR